MRPECVYAIAGAKGGVGKTTSAINLGAALAKQGLETIIVELDLAMANLVDFLDLPAELDGGTAPNLHDVLAERTRAETATYSAPGGMDVLPSGTALAGFPDADVTNLGDVLSELGDYDVALLDTGAGVTHETLVPLGIADETILVSSPQAASVRDVEKTKELTERVGGQVSGIVFVGSGTENSPPVDRIASYLDVTLLGHVPTDPAIPASQDAGRPVVVTDPMSPGAKSYREIGDRIAARQPMRQSTHEDVGTDERTPSEAREPREDEFPPVDTDGSR